MTAIFHSSLKIFGERIVRYTSAHAEEENGKIICLLLPLSLSPLVSKWVRDFCLITQSEDRKYAQLYLSAIQKNNKGLQSVLQQAHLVDVIHTPDWFLLHGGNILSQKELLCIGGNQFWEMVCRYTFPDLPIQERVEVYKKKIQNKLNLTGDTKVLPIGFSSNTNGMNSHVPFRHIDLYISLTGQYYTDTHANKLPIVLVGKPVAVFPEVEALVAKKERQIQKVIDQCLLPAGFYVLRNPMPCVRPLKQPTGTPYFVWYNNSLVESAYTNDRKVYLPFFGTDAWEQHLVKYDAANAKIWSSLGFQGCSIKAPVLHEYAKQNGSVRCLTLELKRIF